MNSEYVNTFIQGTQNVLNMVCQDIPRLGKIFLKRVPIKCDPVSITIDIIGDVKGCVIYTMQPSVACNIVSKMMYGMPVEQLDDMSISAISELGNMISGNIATMFAGKGLSVDITPPNFRLNASQEAFSFIPENAVVFCVPLVLLSDNVFEVDIFLEE